MTVSIPLYELESLLRNYRALAEAYRYDGNAKAANAKRVSAKKIAKVERLIARQKQHNQPKTI